MTEAQAILLASRVQRDLEDGWQSTVVRFRLETDHGATAAESRRIVDRAWQSIHLRLRLNANNPPTTIRLLSALPPAVVGQDNPVTMIIGVLITVIGWRTAVVSRSSGTTWAVWEPLLDEVAEALAASYGQELIGYLVKKVY